MDEFETYKEMKRIEDLMTVKIDVSSTNESMIEDLEREKANLEHKIM